MMDDRIDEAYIGRAVQELVGLVGVKEPPAADLQRLLTEQKPQECISAISRHLGLPVSIQLSIVQRGIDSQDRDTFHSKQLSRVDSSGKGVSGITAQVILPKNMPLFGTKSLEDYPIRVQISDDFAHAPYTFISVIAHELSHVLLHSLGHPQGENEIYTDLVPLLLGFSKFSRAGRRLVESQTQRGFRTVRTTTFGYLNDRQFQFADGIVAGILKKNQSLKRELLHKVDLVDDRAHILRSRVVQFSRLLSHLGDRRRRRIHPEDAQALVGYHSLTHLADRKSLIIDAEREVSKIRHLYGAPTLFTQQTTRGIRRGIHHMNSLLGKMTGEISRIETELQVVRRNLTAMERLTMTIKSFSWK